MYRHKILNSFERSEYKKLYHSIETKNKLFNVVKHSNTILLLWIIILLCGFYFVMPITYDVWTILNFVIGFMTLQILFIVTHMSAHALFLEYENHTIGNVRMTDSIVYYYAFYHHHHTEYDNWMPQLSYYNASGYRNIVAAHWTSYSFVFSKMFLSVMLIIWIWPMMSYYFLGYELAVIILPYAHGWQHIKHDKFNIIIKMFFTFFENIGIVANEYDHHNHHIHTGRTVYQNFSSSGIYSKYLDNKLNQLWNYCFDMAQHNNKNPYDYVVCFEYIVMFLLIVTFVCLLM